jgi:uncharacterized protein DUF4349
MRKPSKIVPRSIPRAGIAAIAIGALALSACRDRDKATHRSAAVAGVGAVAVDSAVGYTGSATARRALVRPTSPEMANESVIADQAMPNAAPAPNDGFAAAAGAPARGDISLGVPLPAIDPTGAMLVRHGEASIQVRGVDAAITGVRQAAAQYGGFVANTSLRTGKDEQHAATLELRVPSDKFEGLLSSLSQLGKVESVTASAEDVAEEYVDLGARAANARRVEARLVELLATRAGKLSDVLRVEQELARVRMETERYDARIRWLEHRASLSSLDVTIHEPLPLIEPQRGPGPMAEALGEAWSRMVGVAAWCVAALGVLIPLGLLVGAVVVVARRFFRGSPKGGELVS